MTESRGPAVKRLLAELRDRRQRRRLRWVEKQAAKKPGSGYSDHWKGGSR